MYFAVSLLYLCSAHTITLECNGYLCLTVTLHCFQTIDGQFKLSFMYRFPDQRNEVCYFAFCYPHSYLECQAKLEGLDKAFAVCKQMTPFSQQDSIYYQRELVCNSLDGLRIDLLTVSSVRGMMQEREEYLPHLFPHRSVPRVHRFKGKKVLYVVSSSVPPWHAHSFDIELSKSKFFTPFNSLAECCVETQFTQQLHCNQNTKIDYLP